jgi:hypothetical protein
VSQNPSIEKTNKTKSRQKCQKPGNESVKSGPQKRFKMPTGSIIENMSSRKLGYVLGLLSTVLIICFLTGALVSPTPNASMQYLATKCVDKTAGKDSKAWFYPRGKGSCQRIDRFDDPEAAKQELTADNIVFAFQMPLPRDNVQIDYSRLVVTIHV